MRRWLSCCFVAIATLSSFTARALEAVTNATTAPRRVVEIRVSGDAAALARVRVTARELLQRLDVEPNVKASDEPETRATDAPVVVAYVDLRNLASPSIDIEDGRTHQELTRRQLTDVTSLETGVESLLHVLYLAVESALQIAGEAPPPAPAPRKKPTPPPAPRRETPPTPFGFDLGPMLRVSSLGDSRIVPGGGLLLEPRADLGRAQVSLGLSAALHASTELSFARGEAAVRPLQIRVVPTFDWPVSPDVSGCVGLGAGLDSLMVAPVQAPDAGSAASPQTALDPVLSGVVGARLPIAGRAFLSALATLDYDLAPTSFVAREGALSRPILQLPRLRAGLTLALSFTAAGRRRFGPSGAER